MLAGLRSGAGGSKPQIPTSCLAKSNLDDAVKAIEDFLGPGYNKIEGGGSELILKSADETRQIRLDLVNSHGQAPHINVEVHAPRNLYPNDERMLIQENHHVFPRIE